MALKCYDISEYQGSDIVQGLADEGAEAVIIKLGEKWRGALDLDPKFVEHVNNAVRCGLKYGVYFVSHAQNEVQALEEAQWINDRIYELLDGHEPELGVWLDVETGDMKNDNTHDLTMKIIDTLGSWGFARVGIYTGYSFFNEWYDLDDLAKRWIPIWVANYGSVNYLAQEHPELNHVAWQFTECCDVFSIDQDEFYGFSQEYR